MDTIGLAAAVVAWLATMLFFSPRVRITDRFNGPDYQVLVHSRRWFRTLVDVTVACELYIPHATERNKERNELTLATSTNSWPRATHDWEGIITLSMDPATLTDFGKARLGERLEELKPPKTIAEISSLLEVIKLMPESWIEVIVVSSDGISGTRNAKHKGFRPQAPG
jgi:hypothetical protein